MKTEIKAVVTIAQKEISDHIWSPLFLLLLGTFTLVLFVFSYQEGMMGDYYQISEESSFIILTGFQNVSSIIGWLAPVIGIALSFDLLITEQRSGSLNVLLTHPVYRDNIILGKLLGSMFLLLVVLVISSAVSVGTLMMTIGEALNSIELSRIAISLIVIYLYTLIFMGIALFFSVLCKDAANSLIYNVLIWICFTVVFSVVLSSVILLCGQDITVNSAGEMLVEKLSNLSPMYHYAKITTGVANIGFGGPGTKSSIKGVFDTRFTISQWVNEFWMNMAVLIATPFILFVASFVAFLKKDVTL